MLKLNWSTSCFSFTLFLSEKSRFLCLSFCGTICFFIFQDIVWQLSHLDVFIVVPFISSTGLAIIAEAIILSCGNFLSEKSCRHKLVVSTSFWSWLLNVSSVFTSLKYAATLFWFVNALWIF